MWPISIALLKMRRCWNSSCTVNSDTCETVRIHISLHEQGVLEALRHWKRSRSANIRDTLQIIVVLGRDELLEELLQAWHRVLGEHEPRTPRLLMKSNAPHSTSLLLNDRHRYSEVIPAHELFSLHP